MEPLLFFESHWLKEHHLVVVSYSWFVMAMLALCSFLATRRMDILPGRFQNVMEAIIGGFDDLLVETMGPEGEVLSADRDSGLYILTKPRPDPVESLTLTSTPRFPAVVVFVMTHGRNQAHGLKYKSISWDRSGGSPSHDADRDHQPPLTASFLSVRLFGQHHGEDINRSSCCWCCSWCLCRFCAYDLHLLIQTLVFMLLTMMYIAGAMEEAH